MKRRGLARLVAATRISAAGIGAAWRSEEAFRLEVALTVVLSPIAILIGNTMLQRALLVASCLLVLIVELLNSAIEATIDRIGAEFHELSGRAKDMGSAAVLVSLLIVILVWSAVVWDRFGSSVSRTNQINSQPASSTRPG